MRTIMMLLVTSLLGFGCTGGTSSPDSGVSTTVDAESIERSDANVPCCDASPEAPGDAGPPFGSGCNPVTQAGCSTGEKCAQLVESASPLLARTACVPDGTALEGNACSRGEPGPSTGYDNCLAGYDCTNGICTAICDLGPPDTCRVDGEAFGDGSYCTPYEGLFTDNIGVCVAGCNPVADSVDNGSVNNDNCAVGEGCYLNATRAVAACAVVPVPAAERGQNEACYGPGTGGCYLNGCASGFTALLNNKPVDADGSVCARYCTPVVTHNQATTQATGLDSHCSDAALIAVGGLNGGTNHQCRFIQTFYSNTDQVPASIGMCVAVTPPLGGTWGDCTEFIWQDIVAAWNGAVMSGTDPNDAFNAVCLVNPQDPMNSEILPECLGLFRGCISREEEDSSLMDPVTPFLGPGAQPFVSPARAAFRDFVSSRRERMLMEDFEGGH